jgi:hypothetical protein
MSEKTNTNVKISTNSVETKEAVISFVTKYGSEIAKGVQQELVSKGVESDPHLKVEGDSIKISSSTGDKGVVLIKTTDGLISAEHSKLSKEQKYAVLDQGVFFIFIKSDFVDKRLGYLRTVKELLNQFDAVGNSEALMKTDTKEAVKEMAAAEVDISGIEE